MSNFTGGNPARGTNKSHRNALYRQPAAFYGAVLAPGALSFLICAGNMRGAVHDGPRVAIFIWNVLMVDADLAEGKDEPKVKRSFIVGHSPPSVKLGVNY